VFDDLVPHLMIATGTSRETPVRASESRQR
jgi:hypothetical protein